MAKVDMFKLKGQILDKRYQVESIVGEGGFGVVYRATQVNFEEPVAIKVLKIPGNLNAQDAETFAETFRNEGRHLRTLSAEHPAFVRAHDTGVLEVDGVPAPYLVLEWLEGEPLEAQFATRREQGGHGRPLQEAMEIMEPIFGALAHAHTQRVAHRDIKPANIFMTHTKSGISAKLLDFGMAKVMTATGAQGLHAATQGGLSGLTPSYAAPEQWDKSMSATGPWTDVYALALVLVELLTDKPALEGDDMPSLMSATLDEESRPTPTTKGATVAPEVEAVFAKALSLHAKDRYLHAAEFWNALVQATAGIGTEQSLPLMAMPIDDMLHPSNFPTESRGASKTKRMKSKPSLVDALADTAAAPNPNDQSASDAHSREVAETKSATTDTTSTSAKEGFFKRSIAIALVAAVILAFVGWNWSKGGNVDDVKTADTTVAKTDEFAESNKPKKKSRRWWDELPEPKDPQAKAKIAALPPLQQKWFALRQQAETLVAQEKADDAIATLRTARKVACEELGENDGACVETLQWLAELLAKMGKYEEAEQLLREAVKLNEKYGDPEDESIDDARQALVRVLTIQGKTEEAKAFSKPTDKLSSTTTAGSNPQASTTSKPPAGSDKTAESAAKRPAKSNGAQSPGDGSGTWTQIVDEISQEKAKIKKAKEVLPKFKFP